MCWLVRIGSVACVGGVLLTLYAQSDPVEKSARTVLDTPVVPTEPSRRVGKSVLAGPFSERGDGETSTAINFPSGASPSQSCTPGGWRSMTPLGS